MIPDPRSSRVCVCLSSATDNTLRFFFLSGTTWGPEVLSFPSGPLTSAGHTPQTGDLPLPADYLGWYQVVGNYSMGVAYSTEGFLNSTVNFWARSGTTWNKISSHALTAGDTGHYIGWDRTLGKVYVVPDNGPVNVFDATSGAPITTISTAVQIRSMVVDTPAHRAYGYTFGSGAARLYVIDTHTDSVVADLSLPFSSDSYDSTYVDEGRGYYYAPWFPVSDQSMARVDRSSNVVDMTSLAGTVVSLGTYCLDPPRGLVHLVDADGSKIVSADSVSGAVRNVFTPPSGAGWHLDAVNGDPPLTVSTNGQLYAGAYTGFGGFGSTWSIMTAGTTPPPLRQHSRDNPARHGHRDDRQQAIRHGAGTYW